jgi:protein-histidine N-methyltransferase
MSWYVATTFTSPSPITDKPKFQLQQNKKEPKTRFKPPYHHAKLPQLANLPDKLSFSTLTLTSPLGHTTSLPRREIFDVRVQLMAEDDGTRSNLLAGLEATDLQTNIYEGGYKTWECALDLVKFLLDRGPRKDLDDLVRVQHVIELGCGSAVPSLLLWMYALREGLGMVFTLADYNEDVVRLVTMPNLVLAWVAGLNAEENKQLLPEGNPLQEREEQDEGHGDLYLTPEILEAFKARLKSAGISLNLLSGSWTPTERFLELVPSTPDMSTFILGSETIYSPASLGAFAETIVALMGRVKTGKTIVAAKRVYFGVGGSVDAFREECARRGAVAYEMEFEGLETGGVRRCLLEVQMC